MTWNYRVCTYLQINENPKTKHIWTSERVFQIHEVYYDDEGKADLRTEDSRPIYGESLEDLKKGYTLMGNAFEEPILDLDNWPNEYVE